MINLGDSVLHIACKKNNVDLILLFITKSLHHFKELPFHLMSDGKRGNSKTFVSHVHVKTNYRKCDFQ